MRLSVANKKEEAHEDCIWTAGWAPKGSGYQLLTGSVDETVKAWSEDISTLGTNFTGHTLGVVSITLHSSGVWAGSSALDSFIRLWDHNNSSTKAIIETPPSETWQIAFQPNVAEPVVAAAGGSSNKITLWGTEPQEGATEEKGKELRSYLLPAGDDKHKRERFVMSVAYSPDGKLVACGTQIGTVAIFDVEAGKLISILEGHYKPVRSLTFTPDSTMLLTACDDMHTHLYDVKHASLIEAFSGHESWVLSVSCHPSGNAFATGSSDAKVKLWNLSTRSLEQTANEHSDQVWGVAFRPDGQQLASVSDDKSVVLYSFSE
ncbi:hypothetical protein WJX74_007448 [Apatococcus lobatus]|uniref:Anaphase-promoting complex subunit 4 WD40 domain-containing protein n=1 Tax=Apatococcus lobatus TaxID=904363 RepID=A0AAW1RK26_9CHLO